MALLIPSNVGDLAEWAKEIVDECTATADERGMVYSRCSQFYYMGSATIEASIYNKCKPFIDKLAGFLMQPTDVRFQLYFDSGEPDDVLERAQLVSEMLTGEFRHTDSDITFAEAVVWALINGVQMLKSRPDGEAFKFSPVHPINFGVLSESTLDLDEQEAFVHVSYPSISQLRTMLEEIEHPDRKAIVDKILETPEHGKDQDEPTYFHQMVIGGMQPLGAGIANPEAAGIVNVFPTPTPWKPQKKISRTVKFCELWIKDRRRGSDYTTLQLVYPDVLIEGQHTRRNLSRIPGRHPFVKVQSQPTPGYFWGRSLLADVHMLQLLLNKRLRDLKIMWDRNVNAPQVFSGFTSVTEEQYLKIISEGGFINDPNPNSKATKLVDPPPQGYMEELQFIFQMFDEAGGFSPIMQGQGEPGVRAGVHAQTLVRTSSPRLIDQAARIERQLADCGYMGLRIMQAMDPSVYITDKGTNFLLTDLPPTVQVMVDSHSASPAFAEDNRQVAIALARANAIDSEDLIHMLHPPGAELLLARLRQRKKEQAQAQQAEEQKDMMKSVIGIQDAKKPRRAGKQRGG